MAKPFELRMGSDGVEDLWYECPGCGGLHIIPVSGPKAWGFNGSAESPTLTPSILSRGGREGKRVCHHFLKDGQIQFLNDCTHELRGQTVRVK